MCKTSQNTATVIKQRAKYQLWLSAVPIFAKYIEETRDDLFKNIVDALGLKISGHALRMQFESGPSQWVSIYGNLSSGRQRIVFTEITKLTHVDEVDNKKLVLLYYILLKLSKTVENWVLDKKTSLQKRGFDMVEDSGYVGMKRQKLLEELKLEDFKKVDYLMQMVIQYKGYFY